MFDQYLATVILYFLQMNLFLFAWVIYISFVSLVILFRLLIEHHFSFAALEAAACTCVSAAYMQ